MHVFPLLHSLMMERQKVSRPLKFKYKLIWLCSQKKISLLLAAMKASSRVTSNVFVHLYSHTSARPPTTLICTCSDNVCYKTCTPRHTFLHCEEHLHNNFQSIKIPKLLIILLKKTAST